jgi:beta-catenin-like protein 1
MFKSSFFSFNREKKLSSNGSLKVLDHSMSGPFGVDNCNKFIDILGLRTIFPLFMKTPKKSKKRTLSVEEHEGENDRFKYRAEVA